MVTIGSGIQTMGAGAATIHKERSGLTSPLRWAFPSGFSDSKIVTLAKQQVILFLSLFIHFFLAALCFTSRKFSDQVWT
jgi:hypothetical protein